MFARSSGQASLPHGVDQGDPPQTWATKPKIAQKIKGACTQLADSVHRTGLITYHITSINQSVPTLTSKCYFPRPPPSYAGPGFDASAGLLYRHVCAAADFVEARQYSPTSGASGARQRPPPGTHRNDYGAYCA
ncbi:hypothetical protein Y032_0105g3653 [Ancylostoma ceylanicum]|uniref:Uncharacterized protein n=1 Tax=Ancylostoma ceylanicum TaxID=53326 RepID=A0A016TG35_9BILA|nr:hypothetical protein Y032_0105g3653 [Ancylostoma ceylanicum]